MIEIIKYPDRKYWLQLIKRAVPDAISIKQSVQTILDRVKKEGDPALLEYSNQFDNSKDDENFLLTEELKQAILQAKSNIEKFHRSQSEGPSKTETTTGVTCWQKLVPVEKVGLYVPGGTAPLFSTVLMLGIPAQIAGCKEIILCCPSSHPTIRYTASLCGISKINKLGGAHAIAAMAYGTGSISKVDKIFGPGNQYVTLAKQLVQQEGIAIDMPAGPSELLVITDETGIPQFIAADLLSQAEHGPDSQVILISTNDSIAKEVIIEINKQLRELPRKHIALQSLGNSKIILVNTLDEAVDFSNTYAPEHLILAVEDPESVAENITNAGSVFLGSYSPEAAGDYATGTNHVLPTNGYARSYSGVSVASFMKKISFQQISKQGLENIADTVMAMAAAEGLQAHKNAINIRL